MELLVAACSASFHRQQVSSSLLVQGEEWRQTALAAAVELFETSFLHSLEADAKDQLALKARNAAAKPSFAW